jgi:hypothetical protein
LPHEWRSRFLPRIALRSIRAIGRGVISPARLLHNNKKTIYVFMPCAQSPAAGQMRRVAASAYQLYLPTTIGGVTNLNGPNVNKKRCLIRLSGCGDVRYWGIGATPTGATEVGAGGGGTAATCGAGGATDCDGGGPAGDGETLRGRSADQGASPGARHVRTWSTSWHSAVSIFGAATAWLA